MNLNFQKTIRMIILITNVALLVAVFYYIWISIYNVDLPIPFFRRGNYVLFMVYTIVLTAFILLMKGHLIGVMRITEIFLSQVIAILLTNVVAYFQVSLLSYKLVQVSGFLGLTALQLTLMIVWVFFSNKIYFKIYAPQKMVFIYDDVGKISIAEKLGEIHERYCIACIANISHDKDIIPTIIDNHEAVVIAVQDIALQEWLVHLCYKKGKRLYLAPSITDVIKNGSESMHAVDTPLLLSRNGRLTNEERIGKRTLDLVCSLAGIIILSPVMILTMCAIWLYDRRNVFYTQDRLTRDGKVFKLYKFRSMIVDAEKNGVCLATSNDSRITPVGRFIRKCRIDEIPQLFNVFKGDMSLVGPRPERPEIATQYENELPEFHYRLNVKAGLTGNAQVHGNYDTSAYDKLLMDLMYIENYSLLHDLSLIFQTLRIILMPGKAEGIKKKSTESQEEQVALCKNQQQESDFVT